MTCCRGLPSCWETGSRACSKNCAAVAARRSPATARAKPKEQAPSTAVDGQILPTPLRLPTYMVSTKSWAPGVALPRWRTWVGCVRSQTTRRSETTYALIDSL